MTHLWGKLSNENVLVVDAVPFLDVGLEVTSLHVVPMNTHVVNLYTEEVNIIERMKNTKLTVQPPSHASRKFCIQVKPFGLELVAGEQVW